MGYDDLLSDGSIRSFSPTRREISALIGVAGSRLEELRRSEFPADIGYELAYDVARAAAQALMASEGYRPATGAGHHETIFKFVGRVDNGRWAREADHFEQARLKRNRALYEEPGLIAEVEAKRLIEAAGDFLEEVRERIDTRWSSDA